MNNVVIIFLAVAFGALHALIGGARMAYALPCYAALALVGILAAGAPVARERCGPRLWCLAITTLLAGYVVARGFASPVAYLARPDMFMAVAALVVYYVVAVHLTAPNERLAVLAVLAIFAFFHILVGAQQFRLGDDQMALPWIFRPPQYFWRASGFFICPSHLALFFQMLAIPAIGICVWSRSGTAIRLVSAYGGLMCVAGIVITGSRESYLSTIVGLVVLAVLCVWVVRKVFPDRLGSASIIAAGLVALLIGSTWYQMRGSEKLTSSLGDHEQVGIRSQLAQASLRQHAENPVFGTGSGTTLYFGRMFRSPAIQNDPVHSSSDHLELLAEYGYVGATLCALFVILHLAAGVLTMKRIVEEKRRATRERQSTELSMTIGGMAAVVVMLLHSLADVALHLPANALLAAFLFGVLANPGSHLLRRYRPFTPARPWLRVATPALAVLLLALVLPRMKAEYFTEIARLALRDGDYASARTNAMTAVEHDRKNPDACYYAGEASHYLGLLDPDAENRFQHYTAAVDWFAAGLGVFPADTRLLLKMARTLDNLGRYSDARGYYEIAAKIDPNFGNVYAQFGLHWQLQGQLMQAREQYTKAAALGETALSRTGAADLEQLRERPLKRRLVHHGLSDFIVEPDAEKPAEEPQSQQAKAAPVAGR